MDGPLFSPVFVLWFSVWDILIPLLSLSPAIGREERGEKAEAR